MLLLMYKIHNLKWSAGLEGAMFLFSSETADLHTHFNLFSNFTNRTPSFQRYDQLI